MPEVQARFDAPKTQKTITELKAEGIDTLDDVIAHYPDVQLTINMRIFDSPDISEADKAKLRTIFEDAIASGCAHYIDEDKKVWSAKPDDENDAPDAETL